MDAEKKTIRKACKEAYSYMAWRNPVGTWFVTLYNKDEDVILEFQYGDYFSRKDRVWVLNLLNEIDVRRNKNETSD